MRTIYIILSLLLVLSFAQDEDRMLNHKHSKSTKTVTTTTTTTSNPASVTPIIPVVIAAPTTTVEVPAPVTTVDIETPATTVEVPAPVTTVDIETPATTVEATTPATPVEATASATTVEATTPAATTSSATSTKSTPSTESTALVYHRCPLPELPGYPVILYPIDKAFIQKCLDFHNYERSLVGTPPVVWNATLAIASQIWADSLAKTRHLTHSQNRYWTGENVGYKTHISKYDNINLLMNNWAKEKANFKYGKYPNTHIVEGKDVGHYTQMIWHKSLTIGCAASNDSKRDYLVCQYYRAGNVVGYYPY